MRIITKKLRILKRIIAVIGLTFSVGVKATIYQYDLSGVITSVDNASNTISVGDYWSYTLLIDGDTPDTGTHRDVGYYDNAILDAVFRSGTVEISTIYPVLDLVRVYDDFGSGSAYPPRDTLTFETAFTDGIIDGLTVSQINVVLWDWSATAFSSINLSESRSVDLDNFQDARAIVLGFSAVADIHGEITSYSVSQVPIPSTVWLFCSALIGLFGIQRRK